jgi:hypothetical protein
VTQTRNKAGEVFVPFVSKVLRKAPGIKPHKTAMPVGSAESYFLDDVEALQEIFSQGTIMALCLEGQGWREESVLPGTNPSKGKVRDLTVWDACGESSFEYTYNSLWFSEWFFNYVRVTKDKAKDFPKEIDLTASGDALVSYWMLSNYGLDDLKMDTTGLSRVNPLVQLRWGPTDKSEMPSDDALRAFINSPLRPVLSWMVPHALAEWKEASDREQFVQWKERQAALLSRWIKAIVATGWLELLVPFIQYFQTLSDDLPEATPSNEEQTECEAIGLRVVQILTERFKGCRQVELQEVRDSEARVLSSITGLGAVADHFKLIHPVHRTNYQKWFLTSYKKLGTGDLSDHLRAVSRVIEGRMG